MATIAVARNAMATRFEILLYGANPVALRAAAEEALDEIERLDAQLSFYRPSSEISNINASAAARPVRVEPQLFRLLQRAQQLSLETGGVFDITIAPLMKCWGFVRGTGQVPDAQTLNESRNKVGMYLLTLEEEEFTVQFAREGVMIDLGAIGKGYAVERAAELLREAGVTSALIQGGTSSAYALGSPPDAAAWNIAIEHPPETIRPEPATPGIRDIHPSNADHTLAIIALRDESLSVSAVWGKSFEIDGKRYGHVIDPRSGQSVCGPLLAAVTLPSATESDAFSTALLTLGVCGLDRITGLRRGMRALVVSQGSKPGLCAFRSLGIEVRPKDGVLSA